MSDRDLPVWLRVARADSARAAEVAARPPQAPVDYATAEHSYSPAWLTREGGIGACTFCGRTRRNARCYRPFARETGVLCARCERPTMADSVCGRCGWTDAAALGWYAEERPADPCAEGAR